MKRWIGFMMALTMVMLSVMQAAAAPVERSLTELGTWKAEGNVQTLEQKENANEAGTGIALLSSGYLPTATSSWDHRLLYGSSVTIEKGKTYQMVVKLKSASSVATNVTLQGMILNNRPEAYKGYTLVTPSASIKDKAIYMMGESTYSAADSQWQTIRTGTVTVKDILDKSNNSVTSMQVVPQMYLLTGQTASLGFYIEKLEFLEVDDGKKTLSVSTAEHGKVLEGESDVTGSSIRVSDGGSKTFTLVPDDGYEVDRVIYGEEEDYTAEIPVDNNNQITLDNITSDCSLTVTFRKIPVTQAVVNQAAVVQGSFQGTDGNTYRGFTTYVKVTKPDAWEWNQMEYGIVLGRVDGQGQSVSLKGNQATEDGNFGIRVYGAEFQAGNSYSVQGYAQKAPEESDTVVRSEQGTVTVAGE
ncbi:MAG: hypothetical protein SO147_04615 [Clostridia bacterium]|nr:hypothetical protein [Clostridia bacterium]